MISHHKHQSWMSLCFWFRQVIHGMEIYWSISRPNLFGLIPLALNSDILDTKPKIIWSLVIHFIVVVSIRSYVCALLMRRPKKLWMNVIQVLVGGIFLVTQLHKKFYELVTSSHPYLKIAFLLSEVSMLARFLIVKPDYHLHRCIQSLLLDHSKNRALILWHITPPWPGGMGIL